MMEQRSNGAEERRGGVLLDGNNMFVLTLTNYLYGNICWLSQLIVLMLFHGDAIGTISDLTN
jgi:hypothetical protein